MKVDILIAFFVGALVGVTVLHSIEHDRPTTDDYKVLKDSLAEARIEAMKNLASGLKTHDSLASERKRIQRHITSHDSIDSLSDLQWRRKWKRDQVRYDTLSSNALEELAIIKYEEYLRKHPNDTLFHRKR